MPIDNAAAGQYNKAKEYSIIYPAFNRVFAGLDNFEVHKMVTGGAENETQIH